MNDKISMELGILALRGVISTAPEAERVKTLECIDKLNAIVQYYGDFGMVAVIIVGLEQMLKGMEMVKK